MNTWFLYFLKKSILQRRGRFLLSAAAVMLTVTAVTALFTVSSGIRERMGLQLKNYGANMVVTDASGKVISDERARVIPALSVSVRAVSYEVYGTVQTGSAVVEVIGRDLERMTGSRIEGRLPRAEGEAMAGARLRARLGIKPGDRLSVAGRRDPLTVTAFFERGTDEDASLLMPLASARDMLGLDGVSAILLNIDTGTMDDFERAVAAADPRLRTRKVLQVAVAEERLLGRVQLLMVLVTSVVLLSSIIALGSTMGAGVIERMTEIGLMTSLGALPGQVRKFFIYEAAAAGISGALAGYAAGSIAAEAIALTAFGGAVPVSLTALPLALMLGTIIAAAAAYFPVRNALNIVPAAVLRGE